MNLEARWLQLNGFSFWFSWNVFQFVSDFHVSSDPQICRFRVPLRADEYVFILVLIFMYSQISRICRFGVALRAAEWFFILVLIFMYLQISRFADLELHWEQLKCFICLKIFHFGPDFHVSSDICGFRVALRAAEGFYVGSDFHVSSDQQDLLRHIECI